MQVYTTKTPENQISKPYKLKKENKGEEKSQKKPNIVLFISLFFFLITIGSVSAYFFYVLPRTTVTNFIDELKPQIKKLKTSTQSVKASIDKIHLLATEENTLQSPEGLETSGFIIHPRVASLTIENNILGISKEKDVSIIESNIIQFAQNLKGTTRLLINPNLNIAGFKTVSEDISLRKTRALKTEALRANEFISKAQNDLLTLITKSSKPPGITSTSLKKKFMESSKILQKANPYFTEANKIADYYQTISDIIITMNTKINSFQISIGSTGSILSNIDQETDNITTFKSILSQAQVFLNQAKNDTEEIRRLSDKLKYIPKSSLPRASDRYHKHNMKVLDAVATYFDSESNTMQGFLNAANSLLTKIEGNKIAPSDLTTFQSSILDGVLRSEKATAQFISDLQTLLGEETTLTISFWQNNTLISSGSLVEIEIDAYEKIISQIERENDIPFIRN